MFESGENECENVIALARYPSTGFGDFGMLSRGTPRSGELRGWRGFMGWVDGREHTRNRSNTPKDREKYIFARKV